MNAAENWREQARYDLETARAMQKSGRYLYVLFCCQQAVEKALKAVIVARTQEHPPRIHTLIRLAEVAKLEVSEVDAEFMRELSTYYLQSRYPEEIRGLARQVTLEQSLAILTRTEEMLKWVFSTM